MGPYFGRSRSSRAPTSERAEDDWGSQIIKKLSASGPVRDGTKPYHHGDLRKALLDATLSLIEENGPQGFTLRGAARRAGVTPGATYHHFKDKEDLVAAVAQEGLDLLWQRLREASEQKVGSARQRARNVGVAYVMFAIENPTRFRVMLGYGVLPRGGANAPPVEAVEAYRFVRDLLVSDLTQSSDDLVSEAEVLGWWSVVHGLAFLAIDGPLGQLIRSERRIESVVHAVIDALDRRSTQFSSVRDRQMG